MLTLRPIRTDDVDFLWEMLYRASWSHLDPGATVASIRENSDLAHYVEGWGRSGDTGLIACDGPARRGAAWVRFLVAEQRESYAYVADDVPELAIGVSDGFEGRGIGTMLLTELLRTMPTTPIVLTARSTNPAINLYRRHGFFVVDTITNRVGSTSLKMVRTPGRSSPG